MTTVLIHPEVEVAVRELRGAIRHVLVSVNADPRYPQDVHRRFSLGSGICWRVSRLERSTTPDEALSFLPSTEAFKTFLGALETGGADGNAVSRAAKAMTALRESVEQYVGDKSTLELVLDASGGAREQLALSRKLAFRGNSGIWGVQARARTHTVVIAPNTDNPDHVDTATVAGWLDVRRIRPDANGSLFRRQHFVEGAPRNLVPLDPRASPGGAMLLPDFCENLPEIRTRIEGDHVHYEAGPTIPGASGTFTIFSGLLQRSHGLRWESDELPEPRFFANLIMPVEQLVIDLIVHESLRSAKEASAAIYSAAFDDSKIQSASTKLPIDCQREVLGSPPVAESTVFSGASELLDLVFSRGGWHQHEFHGLRFRVDYPPFPSVAVVRFPRESRE